ncbi:hypothetical protein G6O67_001180 [Ophiocordyceps sinensis]|uniref:Uncharacterized protein n=1 Tax=Ophiocordyceps sinensis TaxID=72228 RepID=A0A8H4PWX9_9HYPO|nr:hypothetical protein G6O67_001180 [Ophiocordyceps sinensis]
MKVPAPAQEQHREKLGFKGAAELPPKPPQTSGASSPRRASLQHFDVIAAEAGLLRLDKVSHCTISCPELHQPRKHEWSLLPGYDILDVHRGRRGSRSHLSTPLQSQPHRLASRLRFTRPLFMARYRSDAKSDRSEPDPSFQDPRERRRRARDSQNVGSSADSDA